MRNQKNILRRLRDSTKRPSRDPSKQQCWAKTLPRTNTGTLKTTVHVFTYELRKKFLSRVMFRWLSSTIRLLKSSQSKNRALRLILALYIGLSRDLCLKHKRPWLRLIIMQYNSAWLSVKKTIKWLYQHKLATVGIITKEKTNSKVFSIAWTLKAKESESFKKTLKRSKTVLSSKNLWRSLLRKFKKDSSSLKRYLPSTRRENFKAHPTYKKPKSKEQKKSPNLN